jgi:hypothetical protein
MENEDNDVYIPEPPKYYRFKGKDLLTDSYKKPLRNYNKVNIFAYEVRTNGTVPFMQVLLSKSITSKELIFPQIPFIMSIKNEEELISYAKVSLFGMLNAEDFEDFDSLIDFDGFYDISENDLYLFFEITRFKAQLDDIYLNSQLRFALIDEIVNCMNVCNIQINNNVINLFCSRDADFCFLVDENNLKYEIPVVAFTSKPNNLLNYTYVFGEAKSNNTEIFGPYYYFKNFNKTFEDATSSIEVIGIVRYALILGTVKYVENSPDDRIDMSEIKVTKLVDENVDQHLERLTMRITDYDGKWSEKYDSIHLGQLVLDNDEILNKQITAVKEYEQQIPLSYHYINKRTLNGDTTNYSLL